MLKSLKFPLLYIVELALWLPMGFAFFGAISFLAAKPIASLALDGKTLPPGWEAAVPNHGRFLQGYIVSNHPLMFALVIALLLISSFLLYQVHKAQAVQRAAAHGAGVNGHNIARGVVFVVWGGTAFLLVTRVLVGVAAA